MAAINDKIYGIAFKLVEDSAEPIGWLAMTVGHWRRENLSAEQRRELHFEVSAFYITLALRAVDGLATVPEDVRGEITGITCSIAESWLRDAYNDDGLAEAAGKLRQRIGQRLLDYGPQALVLRATAGADKTAQNRLCHMLYERLGVNPDNHEQFYFRIDVFESGLRRTVLMVLDELFRKLGPNTGPQPLYDGDTPWRLALFKTTPGIDRSRPVAPLPSAAAKHLAARSPWLVGSVSSVVVVATVATWWAALIGIVVFALAKAWAAVAGAVLAVPVAVWLARRALASYDKATATRRIRCHGRYVLYLRQSEVDARPPAVNFETKLVRAFAPVAPMLAIKPVRYPIPIRRGEVLHPTGAVPLDTGDDWEHTVVQLIRAAELTIIVGSPRRGYDKKWGEADATWREAEAVCHFAAGSGAVLLSASDGRLPGPGAAPQRRSNVRRVNAALRAASADRSRP